MVRNELDVIKHHNNNDGASEVLLQSAVAAFSNTLSWHEALNLQVI